MILYTPRALQRATLLLTLLLFASWSMTAQAATITVNTNNDEQNTDGDCSLREAIAAANTDAAVDGCTAGDGADTIVFGGGVLLADVTLAQDGFVVTSQIAIDGTLLLGTVTLDGDNRHRIFDVSGDGGLTLSSMALTRGGDVEQGVGLPDPVHRAGGDGDEEGGNGGDERHPDGCIRPPCRTCWLAPIAA